MSVDKLLSLAESEKGYVEKSRAAYDKYGPECLYPKTDFSGCDNLTKYAYELSQAKLGHPNGEPWCQTWIAWLFWKTFGKDAADKLLCGMIRSASTMDVKDAMIRAGRGVPIAEAKPGDLAYRSRSGGGHVGLVLGWENGGLKTLEGNTSADVNSWNGGTVAEHTNATWMWTVRPDYASVTDWHWLLVDGVWYYQDRYGRNSYGWKLIQETTGEAKHWYYFNARGQLQTGHQEINGALYYLYEKEPLEGALCTTDTNGALSPWFL